MVTMDLRNHRLFSRFGKKPRLSRSSSMSVPRYDKKKHDVQVPKGKVVCKDAELNVSKKESGM